MSKIMIILFTLVCYIVNSFRALDVIMDSDSITCVPLSSFGKKLLINWKCGLQSNVDDNESFQFQDIISKLDISISSFQINFTSKSIINKNLVNKNTIKHLRSGFINETLLIVPALKIAPAPMMRMAKYVHYCHYIENSNY
jgi:hypothetical protein